MSISCALLAVALALQAKSNLVSTAGGFEVTMPGKPVEQAKKVPFAAGGEVDTHNYVFEKGNNAYVASYNDYPAFVANMPADALLEGSCKGLMQSSKGKMLVKKDIKFGSIPGKEIEYTFTDDVGKPVTGRSRIYFNKVRLYQVFVVGEDATLVNSKASTEFLDSFKIQGADKGPAPAVVKPNGPVNFVSQTGRFEVKFPSQPAEQVNKYPTADGGELKENLYTIVQGNTVYSVIYQDLPKNMTRESPKKVFDMGVNCGLSALKGKTIAWKSIKLGNIPGTEVTFTTESSNGSKSTGRMRFYLDKERLYHLGVLSDTDLATSAAGNAFFESFKIKPRGK